ncbi:hypothetical protein PsorP6_019451 [Peronosclerospora sorghi]|nr:hypothetical protein PsorP6_019451 [Peronosclerospora sorghi]
MLQKDLTTGQRPDMHNRARWRLGSLFYGKIPSMILVLVPLQTRVLFIWRIRGVLSLPIFAKKPEWRQKSGGNDSSFDFVPAEFRGRPNQLRLEAFLPANTTLVFSLQMEKLFLRYSEHPPDANRGFDIASGAATFNIQRDSMEQSTCCQLVLSPGFTTTLFTEPLLVLLPTPDFSMPYNDITMTSTVVAFLVGTTLNTLLRKAPRLKQMMSTQRNNDRTLVQSLPNLEIPVHHCNNNIQT